MTAFAAQRIRFGYDLSADWANKDERTREVAVLRALPEQAWTAPSRCPGWTGQDVVRHVVQMNDTLVGAINAARQGVRDERLRGFDPTRTPQQWLDELAGESPTESLCAYERSTADLVALVDGLDGTELLVATPAGRQPWQRAVYHGLLDAVVHERDITEPLGASHPPYPTHEPVLGYALLLASRIACAAGHSFAIALDLGEDISPIEVSVRNDEVAVAPASTGFVEADPLLLLDALAGRAPLDAVLPDVPARSALDLVARSF